MSSPEQNELEKGSVNRVATISQRIREAIRSSLPAPPEQFFHVMVPGKVVNFSDYTDGFDENGQATSILSSNKTELNQAILCDDMPALAPVQLGPTGKSVSRSYAATLSKLVPSGTTVGVEVADPNKLTDAEKRYQRAMDWLLAEDIRNPGKTHLDSYIEKQRLYAEAEKIKIREFDNAYKDVTKDPLLKTNSQRRAAYDKWVHENARTLRNSVEAAYKDWVIHGRKEAVEYWFAVVDNESAMARVEQSKEAMRNSVVTDVDGSVTYPKVSLSPSNWAWICQQKINAKTDETRTAAQITWDILRIEKQQRMLEVLMKEPPKLLGPDGNAPVAPESEGKESDETLRKASKEYIDKTTALDNIRRNPKTSKNGEEIEKARKAVADAKAALDKAYAEYDKDTIARLSAMNLVALDELYSKSKEQLSKIHDANKKRIEGLTEERKVLLDAKKVDTAESIGQFLPGGAPRLAVAAAGQQDYFIPITVEISASSKTSTTDQHSLSMAASAEASMGLFSAGVSGTLASSTTDAESQMANSDVKVSFEVMRVDITRSWLRPELFYDEDLRAAPGALISPGHVKLAALMDPNAYPNVYTGISAEEREKELQRYSTFPIYPTAFLLACNVVLEISGESSAIQSHFDSSSTTAKSSAAYGPFQVGTASSSSSAQHSSASCETTASGCRITIKSPQIIGWISEMVPALPRNGAAAPPATTNDTAAVVPEVAVPTGGQPPSQEAPAPAPAPGPVPFLPIKTGPNPIGKR